MYTILLNPVIFSTTPSPKIRIPDEFIEKFNIN